MILQAHPTLRGILFDMAHVVEGAQETMAAQGCAARCAAVAGDFFRAVPSGGDAYLVNNVLRDWDDARSTVILRNCQRAAPQARLSLRDRLLSGITQSMLHSIILETYAL